MITVTNINEQLNTCSECRNKFGNGIDTVHPFMNENGYKRDVYEWQSLLVQRRSLPDVNVYWMYGGGGDEVKT